MQIELLEQVGVADVDHLGAAIDEAMSGVGMPECVIDDAGLLEHLAYAEPGPLSMAMLVGIDVNSLDDDARPSYAHEWQRQQAWVTAQAQCALADVLVSNLPDDESKIGDELNYRAEMVATTLRWPPSSAMGRLLEAFRVVYELPGTFALLADGQISYRHALVMSDATTGLDGPSIALVESRALEKASGQTPAEFGRAVRRAALTVAPLSAQIQHDQAVRLRHVRRAVGRDGMATLLAVLPAADAEAVYLALDAVARKAAADDAAAERAGADPKSADPDSAISIGARRADALVAWALAALADPTLPTEHGRPVQLRVTIDLASLLGMADNPAELSHYGAIPASVARTLAADATWQRFVTDPVTGYLLDFGRTVYRPPQALRDFLVARDRVCRFPGCSMAAERSDLDHGQPYDKGGHTSACNCHALCRRHHIAKTTGGWQLKCSGDGSVTWISPTGTQYFARAENHDPALR